MQENNKPEPVPENLQGILRLCRIHYRLLNVTRYPQPILSWSLRVTRGGDCGSPPPCPIVSNARELAFSLNAHALLRATACSLMPVVDEKGEL